MNGERKEKKERREAQREWQNCSKSFGLELLESSGPRKSSFFFSLVAPYLSSFSSSPFCCCCTFSSFFIAFNVHTGGSHSPEDPPRRHKIAEIVISRPLNTFGRTLRLGRIPPPRPLPHPPLPPTSGQWAGLPHLKFAPEWVAPLRESFIISDSLRAYFAGSRCGGETPRLGTPAFALPTIQWKHV